MSFCFPFFTRFARLIPLCALLCTSNAFAQNSTAEPAVNVQQLSQQFVDLDVAWQAAARNSEKRAVATEAAMKSAAQIAWSQFESGNYDQAATWFARRSDLRREAYRTRLAMLTAQKLTARGEIVLGQRQARQAWSKLQSTQPALARALQTRLKAQNLPQFPELPLDYASSMATQKSIGALLQPLYAELKRALAAKNLQRSTPLSARTTILSDINAALARVSINSTQLTILAAQRQILVRESSQNSQLLGFMLEDLSQARSELAQWKKAKVRASSLWDKTVQVAQAIENVAGAREDVGFYQAAHADYAAAIALRRSLPANHPEHVLDRPLASWGRNYQLLGDFQRARELYLRALSELQKGAKLRAAASATQSPLQRSVASVVATVSEVVALNNLADVTSQFGDLRAALSFNQRARARVEDLPKDGPFAQFRPSLSALTRGNRAAMLFDSGETQNAMQEFDAVILIQRQGGEDERAATSLQNAGALLWENGKKEAARRYIEQARALYVASQDLRGVSSSNNFLARMALESDDVAGAENFNRQAVASARISGDKSWIARTLRGLAQLRLAQKRPQEALQVLAEVSALEKPIGAPMDLARTLEVWGRALQVLARDDEAIEKYKAAIERLESVRAKVDNKNFSEQEIV